MIASLSGTIQSKLEKSIVVDVNGVGYHVLTPRTVIEKIVEGEAIRLSIHTHVREDAISLYGFLTNAEWKFFELLLTVSGVGPKTALEILNLPMVKVQSAIAKKDAAFLTRIQGLGKKTAERIIVDLEGKMKKVSLEDITDGDRDVNDEILHALISLGYPRHHVIAGLKKIPSEVTGEEAIIKYFLQNV